MEAIFNHPRAGIAARCGGRFGQSACSHVEVEPTVYHLPPFCNPMTRVLRIDDEGDRDLVRKISCADRDAFQQLYLDYHKRLARFLVRLVGRCDDLEEVINDALLIVWQRAGDFRGASRVSTWIFGIAYRCALKSIRKSKAHSGAMMLEFRDGEAVAKDAIGEAENRQLLDLALASLPHDQRLVLILAYYRDFSCEEIAAIVDCPVNTVKSRMFQARRKLHSIISAAPAARVC
jgi:RNA polymerase sigma-70 factor, ECF subfamily